VPLDGAFSPIHWLIVAVVVLLVLGPDKLPEAARSAARAWREFQQVRGTLRDQIRNLADETVPSELREHAGVARDTAPVDVAEPRDGHRL
jgi:TatA/E family protein of Tat protein translocase